MRGWLPTLLVLVAGSSASLVAYRLAANWDSGASHERFQQEAAVQARAVQEALRDALISAEAVAHFYQSSQEVRQEELALFIRPFLSRMPGIRAAGWAPRVPERERTEVETRAYLGGLGRFRIHDLGEETEPRPRAEYFPLYRIELHDDAQAPPGLDLGIDLAAVPAWRSALERARDSGAPAATPLLPLGNEPGAGRGLMIVAPHAYREPLGDTQEERRQRLAGFALLILDPGKLADDAIAALPLGRLDSRLSFGARPDAASPVLLRGSRVRPPGSRPHASAFAEAPLKRVTRLTLADRVIELTAIPAPGAYRASPWPLALLGLGLLITALLAGLAAYRLRVARRLDAQWQLFRLFMDHSPSVAWIKDAEGRYTYLNDTYLRRFGASLADWRGKTDSDLWPEPYASAFLANDRAMLEAGHPQTFREISPATPGGSPSYWESVKFPFRDPAGRRYLGGISIEITARRETELALRRYQQIVENASDMLLFIDADLRYQVVNPAYAALKQTTPEALEGRLVREVEPPWIWTQIAPHLEATLAGERRALKTHGRGPDGEECILEAEHRPFVVEGKVQGIVACLRNVTESERLRRALEDHRHELEDLVATRTAALRESEQRWKFALEGPGDGVWDWDIPTSRVFYSAGWAKMLGFDECEIEPKLDTWETRLHPADKPRVMLALQAHLDGRTPSYVSEHRLRCKDGSWKWVLDRGMVVRRAADGQPQRAIGAHTDITERREAQEALRTSEARARAVIQAAPVPMAICDGSHAITEINPAFVAAFGYTHSEIPTLPDWWPRAYPDPAYRDWVIDAWTARLVALARGGGRFEPLEVNICRRDGARRTAIVTATPLGGTLADHYLTTFHDVTELKEAREAAEQAARLKSELLANMSHEIRTPMNAMLGLAQLLERESLSGDQRHMVRQIRAAASSLLQIVNDVLDYSKIEAGRLRLDPRPFDLGILLAYIQSLMGQLADTKGLTLNLAVPDAGSGALLGDPLRLQQILVNLLGNAIKFTEIGEVRLAIASSPSEPPGVRLRFAVTDTGIGIAPEHLATICAPFVQADGSITRRFGGTGLGLSITRQLTELMGGTFGVESQLGVGSTFWVELPFTRLSTSESPAPTLREPPAAAGPRLSGLHLLVADDSRMNREVVERALRREGARATSASDGHQALERLRAAPSDFDAVLMDVQMPVMDGLTAVRAVRCELGLWRLPIIAFSAGVLAEQRQETLDAGFDDFLAKPIELDDLIRAISRWARPKVPAGPMLPEAVAEERSAPDFPLIDGLDTRRAAILLDNDRTFFFGLLRLFAEEHGDSARRVRHLLADGDGAEARRLLHRLRAISGNIGALSLASDALALETAIQAHGPEVRARLDAFEAALDTLLAAIAGWQDTVEPEPAVGARDQAAEGARLAALRTALGHRDLAALELVATLRLLLVERLGESGAERLAEAVRGLRFEQALSLLDPAQGPPPGHLGRTT